MDAIPVNGARGEVRVALAGRSARLCLTLGALAEIETALGSDGAGLGARLARLGARDLMIVLQALARGGGDALSDAEIGQVPAAAAARAVAAALQAAAGAGNER